MSCGIKEKLKQYRYMKQELEQLEDDLEEWRSKAESIKSTQFDEIPCGSNASNDISDIITKIVELEQRRNDKLRVVLEEQRIIDELIDNLPERERVLIRKRYKEGKEWERICVEMNYSWRKTHYIHAGALKILEQKKLLR